MTVSLQGDVAPTLLVPEEAIVPERGRTYSSSRTASRNAARCAPKRRPGDVEIVEGITENERVVVEGAEHPRHERPRGADRCRGHEARRVSVRRPVFATVMSMLP